MTGVMSDHNVAPMLPFTMHGSVCPIIGNGCRVGGPRGSRPRQRALRVPRPRQKYAKGVGRFDDVMGISPPEALRWGSGEAGTSLKPLAT